MLKKSKQHNISYQSHALAEQGEGQSELLAVAALIQTKKAALGQRTALRHRGAGGHALVPTNEGKTTVPVPGAPAAGRLAVTLEQWQKEWWWLCAEADATRWRR